MCGSTGLFDTQSRREVDRARLHRVNDSLWRRVPDDGALQLESGMGFSHRHRRIETTQRTTLAAVDDISVNGDASMVSSCLDAILTDQYITDSTRKTISGQLIVHLIASCSYSKGAPVNVQVLRFKEYRGGMQNSKTLGLIHEFQSYGVEVFVTDPQAELEEPMHERGELSCADAVAIARRDCAALSVDELRKKMGKGGRASMSSQPLISKPWLMRAPASGASEPTHV